MKFWLAPLLVLFFGSVQALAADGSSGCGAGWYVFKENSLVSSFLRLYTNATFSSTLGMTSGTSNCSKHSIVDNQKRSQHFAESNYDMLMVESAQGQGQYLAAFADTFGCGFQTLEAFEQDLKSNYDEVFQEGNQASDLVFHIRQRISINPALSKGCVAA